MYLHKGGGFGTVVPPVIILMPGEGLGEAAAEVGIAVLLQPARL